MQAEEEIDSILKGIIDAGVTDSELEKVKNQAETSLEFGEVEVMNRAMNLAFASLSGDANLVNLEAGKIRAVTRQDIHRVANEILREENSNVLHYHAISKKS